MGRIPGIGAVALGGVESLVNIILNNSLRKYGATALSGYAIDGATLAISVGTIVTATSSLIRQAIRFSILMTTAYADALMSMLSLQTAMLASFGNSGELNPQWTNGMTGAAVCLIVSLIGIYMIISSK